MKEILDVDTSKRRILRRENVLNLKPKFRVRHPWIWILGCFVAIAMLFTGLHTILTRAEAQDFYPATCLGNWQNPANAQGEPETLVATGTAFTTDNSAVDNASATEIFCGGFLSGNEPTSSAITNVGLTLVWQIEDATTTLVITTSTVSATTTIATTTMIATTSSAAFSSASIGGGGITDDGLTVSSTSIAPSSTDDVASTSDITSIATTTPTDTITGITTDAAIAATTTDIAATTTNNIDAAPPVDNSAPTSTSLLRLFIPFAYADDMSSSVTSSIPDVSSTESIDAIPSSTTTSTQTAGQSQPDENFMEISYSTDGQNWIDIGEVNIDNWSNFTVTLPISNWQDLTNLQVRAENIPTTQDPVPPVYLDGMFLEAHYELQQSPVVSDLANMINAVESPLAPPPPPPPPSPPIVRPAPEPIYDKDAKQTCSVEPFSKTIAPGTSGIFTMALSSHASSTAYGLEMGKLPIGVSSTLGVTSGPAAPATTTITLTIDPDAKSGSFNAVVIYREFYQSVNNSLSNFCQFNFVIGG